MPHKYVEMCKYSFGQFHCWRSLNSFCGHGVCQHSPKFFFCLPKVHSRFFIQIVSVLWTCTDCTLLFDPLLFLIFPWDFSHLSATRKAWSPRPVTYTWAFFSRKEKRSILYELQLWIYYWVIFVFIVHWLYVDYVKYTALFNAFKTVYLLMCSGGDWPLNIIKAW